MTQTKPVTYSSLDAWLAANPLYVWRGRGKAPKPMEYVARECNATRQSVLNWERGDFMPKHRYLELLAEMMRLRPETLYAKWKIWLKARPAEPAQVSADQCSYAPAHVDA